MKESIFKSASLSLDRNLSKNVSVFGRLAWREDEPKDDLGEELGFIVQQSETWTANLGMRRQLNTQTSLSFDYQYTDRQSDSLINEYRENRFTLTLRVNL